MGISLKKKIILPSILIILTTVPILPLIKGGFFFMQDDLQAFRVHQMTKCLLDYQIPCRWVPDMGYQYGYPQFNFYPPGVYYLGALIHLLGFQIIDAVKILFFLGFILASFAMFIFLKVFLNDWAAFVGAVLYSYAPFKAVEIYVRGSLSELWSFVFFPLIFWSIYQLTNSGKLKYMAWLAISIGLLLITHNLMSFIFLPIFGIWSLLLILLKKKWVLFPRIILSSILGLGLAAFFTLPVIFEAKYAHLESLLGGYFDYRQHFVDIKQLFLSNHFGYGSSFFGPNDDLSLSVGIVHWIAGALAVIFAILNFKKMKKISIITLTIATVELIVLFLMHQRSSFIWEKLTVLSYLQFPWRFLSDSLFLLSILGAISIYFLSKFNKRWGIVGGVLVLITVFILHASFFYPKEWFDISDKDKFSGKSWEKQLTISIFDYLPIYAKLPPNKIAPELPDTLDGEAEFLTYKKGSNYQMGELKVDKEATITLPLFDFPGMEVLVNQKKVGHWHDDCRGQEYCLGLITFKLPVGTHEIEARLKDTPVRRIGNIITILAICFIAWLFYLNKKNEKDFI